MHILHFQILFWEKRNQRNKNDNVVRTLNWIRTVNKVNSVFNITEMVFELFKCSLVGYLFTSNEVGSYFEMNEKIGCSIIYAVYLAIQVNRIWNGSGTGKSLKWNSSLFNILFNVVAYNIGKILPWPACHLRSPDVGRREPDVLQTSVITVIPS